MRIDDDYLEPAFKGEAGRAPAVATGAVDPTLQVVFGRAFLVEVQRGDMELARIFARALLQTRPAKD